MPIYEYCCAACGARQEVLQKMGAPLLTDCPDCGKPTLKKMVSAAGFHLKGSGWYATDFKHGAKPQPKPGDAAASAEKTDAKSEDKSAPASGDKAAPEKTTKKSDDAAPATKSGSDAAPASS